MTIFESNNRHSSETLKGLEYLKKLSASMDGWNLSLESRYVKVYTQDVEGLPLPILRGDTVLEGDYNIHQVAAVALAPGCRHICKCSVLLRFFLLTSIFLINKLI